ncbi:hypothetical protein, partial [Methylobacterium platani]|uniref:hypothetical protein n=1 Tax=Methylobacterium platani TaxID=427683 RepID=UPI001AE071FE
DVYKNQALSRRSVSNSWSAPRRRLTSGVLAAAMDCSGCREFGTVRSLFCGLVWHPQRRLDSG